MCVELSWVGGEGGAPWTQIKWGPEGCGPEEWGPQPRKSGVRRVGAKSGAGRVGVRRVGSPKFRAFFPSPVQNSFFSSLSGGLLVEFRWCLKRRGAQMCTFGVLGLSVTYSFIQIGMNLALFIQNHFHPKTTFSSQTTFIPKPHSSQTTFIQPFRTILSRTTPTPDRPSAGPPKILLFFFLPLLPQFSFFPPLLGVFSLNFGGVFEGLDPQMCTFGLSGCRVKPRRRGRSSGGPQNERQKRIQKKKKEKKKEKRERKHAYNCVKLRLL